MSARRVTFKGSRSLIGGLSVEGQLSVAADNVNKVASSYHTVTRACKTIRVGQRFVLQPQQTPDI